MLVPITGSAGFVRIGFVLERSAANRKSVVSPNKLTCTRSSEDLRGFEDYEQKIFIKRNIDIEVSA